MKKKPAAIPVFKTESDEADWWASAEGRRFVKQRSAEAARKNKKYEGSPLLARLNKTSTVQIALRLPETDLAQA
jgi:hypothetical protein